jgi:DHA1 family multidrug resistance protein-like MFS transporter
VLGLDSRQISINFMVFGIVGLIAQGIIVPALTKWRGETRMLRLSLLVGTIMFIGYYRATSLTMLLTVSIIYSLADAFVMPLVKSLLSKEVDEHSQGAVQGVNASYMSIGMILGPIIGGAAATISVQTPFLVGSVLVFLCLLLSQRIIIAKRKQAVL